MEKILYEKLNNFTKSLTCYRFEKEKEIFIKTHKDTSSYKNIQALVKITSFLHDHNIKHSVLEDESIILLK